ncbi:hypothetical protein Dimus_005701 [Dionaea muscipula]
MASASVIGKQTEQAWFSADGWASAVVPLGGKWRWAMMGGRRCDDRRWRWTTMTVIGAGDGLVLGWVWVGDGWLLLLSAVVWLVMVWVWVVTGEQQVGDDLGWVEDGRRV